MNSVCFFVYSVKKPEKAQGRPA